MNEKKLKPLHESMIDSFVKFEEELLIRFGVSSIFIIAFRVQSETVINLVNETEIEKSHLSHTVKQLEEFRQKFLYRWKSNSILANDKELIFIDRNFANLAINLTKRMTSKNDLAKKIPAN